MKRLILYFGAALTATLVNASSRYLLSKWIAFAAAVVIAYWIGHIVNFVLSNTFVFEGKEERSTVKSFIKFTLVACIGLAVTFGVSLSVKFFLEKLFPLWDSELRETLAHLCGIGCSFVFNYIGHVFFSFRKSHKNDGE